MRRMNKRGDIGGVLWEYLQIPVTILVILGLVALLFQLYGLFKGRNDLEKARVHMDNIINELNNLKEGGSVEYALYSPTGYALSAWPYKGVMPASCSVNGWRDCICLCKKSGAIPWVTDNTKGGAKGACDSEGICKEVKKNIFVGNELELDLWIAKINLGQTQYPLEVKWLIEQKRGIVISLKDGKYFVLPTKEVKKI